MFFVRDKKAQSVLEKHKGRFSAKKKIMWFVYELQRYIRNM